MSKIFSSSSSSVFTNVNGHTRSKVIKENLELNNRKGSGTIEVVSENDGKRKKEYKKLTRSDVEDILLYPSKRKSTIKRLYNRFLRPRTKINRKRK